MSDSVTVGLGSRGTAGRFIAILLSISVIACSLCTFVDPRPEPESLALDGPAGASVGIDDQRSDFYRGITPTGLFFENVGQVIDDRVHFFVAVSEGVVFFMEGGMSWVWMWADESTSYEPPSVHTLPHTDRLNTGLDMKNNLKFNRVDYSFIGSSHVIPRGEMTNGWTSNYISEGDGWSCQPIRTFRSVVYKALVPGIDLRYWSVDGKLKYEFSIAPRARPEDISIHIEGHDRLELNGPDSLSLTIPSGNLVDDGLIAHYQDGEREQIPSSFNIEGGSDISFSLGCYDRNRPIIIDPLMYSTFLGSTNTEFVEDIAIDDEGCVYTTGWTYSPAFPTTPGAYNGTLNGGCDVFVTKLSADGASLGFSTYIGGSDIDMSYDIEVGPDGDICICGVTYSTDFPTTGDAYQRDYGGGEFEGFFAVLDKTGCSLVQSSYLGGTGYDTITAMEIDDEENLILAGATSSMDFLTTPGAYRSDRGPIWDGFLFKIGDPWSSPGFSTYLGHAYCEDLVLDEGGCAMITGLAGTDIPVSPGAYQEVSPGRDDAFVMKVSAGGDTLHFSTLLGGSGRDWAEGIDVDRNGHSYVTGFTSSIDFPTTKGAFSEKQASPNHYEVFVSIIASNGSALVNSTYLGGEYDDVGYDISIDPNGYVFVVGATESADFPTTVGTFQENHSSPAEYDDAFLSKLSGDLGQLHYSTMIGGSNMDEATSIESDEYWTAFVGGDTKSKDFPVSPGTFQGRKDTSFEAFAMKISTDMDPPLAHAGPDIAVDQNEVFSLDGSNSTDNVGVEIWVWHYMVDYVEVSLKGANVDLSFSDAGVYTITLNVTDKAGNWGMDELVVTVLDITSPQAEAGEDITIDQHETAFLNGSESTDNVGISNWTWFMTIEEEEVILFGLTTSHTFHMAGTFEVILVVRDLKGNTGTDMLTVTVVDTTSPSANAGEDGEYPQGSMIGFDSTGSSDNVGIVNQKWSFEYNGSTIVIRGPSPGFVFNIVGVYSILLRVMDAAGNWDEDVVNVTILDIIPPIALAGPDVTIDQGERLEFDGSGSHDNVDIEIYEWSFDTLDGPVELTGMMTSYTFHQPGSYEVCLMVVDSHGNDGTDTLMVRVVDTERPNCDAGSDQTIDVFDDVSFDGSDSTDNVGIVQWLWSFKYYGRDVVLEGNKASFRFDQVGTFNITLAVYDAAGNHGVDELVVDAVDTIAPRADAGNNVTVYLGDEVILNGTGSYDNVGITNWTWRFHYNGSYQILDGERVSFIYSGIGNFTITLEVYDSSGNGDTDTIWVNVIPRSDASSDGAIYTDDSTLWDYLLALLLIGVVIIGWIMFKRR